MVERSSGPADADARGDDADIEVGETWVDRVVVVSVSGMVDMLTAPQLTEAIATAAAKAPAGLIVDLSKVEFLSSAGMSVLVAAHGDVTLSARFGVVADGSATSRPITLLGINDLVALYRTLDAAVSDFTA
jgi:anti-sigma B factor antagonist